MNGFLLVDKPSGLTSFDVVSRIRKLLRVKRAGHCGTLDPLATGLLIVCLERATKLAPYVMNQEKRYVADITFGAVSTTYDAEGELSRVETDSVPSREQLFEELSRFIGEIEQMPPLYSAIKFRGKPLYKYARANQDVEPQRRRVIIHDIRLEKYDYPEARLAVTCSAGTYIRSLAHELGQALGCGAWLSGLRRTHSGSCDVDSAVTLRQLEDLKSAEIERDVLVKNPLVGRAYRSMEEMLSLPAVYLQAGRCEAVTNGVPIRAQDVARTDSEIHISDLVQLVGSRGNLLAVARSLVDFTNLPSLQDVRIVEYVRVI